MLWFTYRGEFGRAGVGGRTEWTGDHPTGEETHHCLSVAHIAPSRVPIAAAWSGCGQDDPTVMCKLAQRSVLTRGLTYSVGCSSTVPRSRLRDCRG